MTEESETGTAPQDGASADPPKKEGMSTQKKVLIGCGGCAAMSLFMMLAMGTCTAVGVREVAKEQKAGEQKIETQEADVKINAWQLLSEYKSNEVAADQKYKGKILEVSGIVGDIKKDILDDLYVTLGSGGRFEMQQVRCSFQKKYTERLASLRKHSRLTVRGRCKGLMMNVMLEDCIIVE